MQKTVTIVHTTNDAYHNSGRSGFAKSEVEVCLGNRCIWWQTASEGVIQDPENAFFYRDLNDPAAIIDMIKDLVGDDGNYNLYFVNKKEG